ncbi:MAG: hypothetical protein SH808_02040 [Saprospiraceae bacterium]|nr:hypothetical protein [Saprospiraceae bacterium]
MKKSKIKQVLNLIRVYFTNVILVFGIFTLLDFLFFEEVMDNEIILSNLWKSPFMALLFLFLNRVMAEEDSEVKHNVMPGEKV